MQREDERDTVRAWTIGLRSGQAFAGKLPDLSKVLKPPVEKPRSERTRTDRDLTVLHMLSARYGIPLRKTRLRRVPA